MTQRVSLEDSKETASLAPQEWRTAIRNRKDDFGSSGSIEVTKFFTFGQAIEDLNFSKNDFTPLVGDREFGLSGVSLDGQCIRGRSGDGLSDGEKPAVHGEGESGEDSDRYHQLACSALVLLRVAVVGRRGDGTHVPAVRANVVSHFESLSPAVDSHRGQGTGFRLSSSLITRFTIYILLMIRAERGVKNTG